MSLLLALPRSTGPLHRTGPFLALVLLGGLAWGAATSGLQTVLPPPWSVLANGISPWVAPAFAAGLLARRAPLALAAGLLVCWGEVLGYYGTSALRGFGVGVLALVWLVAAAVGGPVFGGAGWLWRRARRRWSALGAALLAGVLVTEGAVLHGAVLGHTGQAVLLCALGAVAALGLGLRRQQLPLVLAWSLLVLPLGALGVLAVVSLL